MNMIIEPTSLINADVTKAGWITSAFLLAFYTFGYRYIANDYMDPVRKYIWDFLNGRTSPIPGSVSMGEYKNKQIYYSEPQLEVNVPLNPPDPVSVQVKLYSYVVNLPFSFFSSVMVPFLEVVAPQIFDKDGSLRKDIGLDTFLAISVQCTKTGPHECIWDYVLGRKLSKTD